MKVFLSFQQKFQCDDSTDKGDRESYAVTYNFERRSVGKFNFSRSFYQFRVVEAALNAQDVLSLAKRLHNLDGDLMWKKGKDARRNRISDCIWQSLLASLEESCWSEEELLSF